MVGWRASLFAVSCLVLGGCGTTTVWYGHTPDRSRRVEHTPDVFARDRPIA